VPTFWRTILLKIILDRSTRTSAALSSMRMPVDTMPLPNGIGKNTQMVAARFSSGSAWYRHFVVLLAAVSAVLVCLPAGAQTTPPPPPPVYVPAVVASSVSPVPSPLYPLPLTGTQTNLKTPSEVAVDACGNIYALDHGYDGRAQVIEIPAGGGPGSIAYVVNNSYAVHLGQDATHANLLSGAAYNTGVNLTPVTGCVPQASQSKKVGGGNGALFYYYNSSHSAGDFSGNTYLSTNQTCCVTGPYYLVQEVNGSGNILLSNQPNEILSLTVDKLQNVYFISGAAVYELPYAAGKYATAPVAFGKYINPVGLSVDGAGNLYVADSSAGTIYEIPTEGTAGPNIADQFTVSSGLKINVPVALNARGDMYYTAAGATGISELTLGNANFNSMAVGQSATRVLNFQFNVPVNVTNIQAPGGDFTIQPASVGTTACVTSTTYQPTVTFTGATATGSTSVTSVSSTTGLAAGQLITGNGIPPLTTIASVGSGTITLSAAAKATTPAGSSTSLLAGNSNCQITVGFTPSKAGKQSSAVVLTYTIGTVSTTLNTFVEGIGQGALLTLDPGTVTPAGSGFRSPEGAAVDGAGNTFVADIGANAVLEFPAGGGAAVTVAIQSAGVGVTTPLAAPAGVAVDGAGDLFIADTGNNRVVEVPAVNGVLNPAGSTVIATGLKNPASVFVHTNGDLYVADTGDNTILIYPSFAGSSNNGSAFAAPVKLGIGLSAPLAVTVDGPGNTFIADSGNNQILEYPLGAGQEIVAANILNPSALATDNSGSLFVVDQGNFRVLRIPSVQGTLNPNNAAEVGLGVSNPYGLAIDGLSNLYVTDKTNAAAYSIARSQVSLAFGDLALTTSSTALPLTVESAGNLPLVFAVPYFTETGNSGDFAMSSPTGACADGLTLAIGTSCDLSTSFTPTAAGSRSATIVFASSATNLPQLTLTGTGVAPSPTTTTLALITSVPGAPFYGEPLSFTATIAPTSGTGTATGVVSFVLDGTQISLASLVKGVATLQLNSGLNGGVHVIYAAYKGDVADNASSSAVMTVTINKAPTVPTLVITTVTNTNPYSLRHSNTGSCSVTDTTRNVASFAAIPNDPIGFTATVTSPGVGVPSGTLTFYSDGLPINGVAPAPNLSLVGGGTFPNNQTVYVVLTLTGDFGETVAGPAATVTTTALNSGVSVAIANSYGPAANGVKVYEADVASGSAAPTTYHLVGSYALGATAVINSTAKGVTPPARDTSSTPLLPISGGGFAGNMSSDANTLGDGTILGENNVLLGPHVITVVYSGDQNYLPSTSVGTTVTVVDVSPTTPVVLPVTPVSPAPYCDANSSIKGSRPAVPSTYTVTASSTTINASAGQPGTTTLTISSLGGWVGSIEFSCPDLPKYATCSTNPGQVFIQQASTAGATLLPTQAVLTITTNVPTYVPTAAQGRFFWPSCVLLGLLMVLSRRRFVKAAGGLTVMGLVLLFGGVAGFSGCSSSTTSTVATPPGSYAVHVVLTSAQLAPNRQYATEVYRADLPYQLTFTLNVK
jgi:sugar lactone lactonase YvrE